MPGARVECRPVSFLDVILRGVALSGQALALGGVAFVLVVLRRSRRDAIGPDEHPSTGGSRVRLQRLEIAGDQRTIDAYLGTSAHQPLDGVDVEWVISDDGTGVVGAEFATANGSVRID